MRFGEQILCTLSEDVSFESLLPYGPMLATTTTPLAKSKI